MKQTVLIIVGSIILSLLIALGVYLFFFYGTAADDQFANLGPEGQADGGVVIPPTPLPPSDDTATAPRPRLRQLTTRPVIGFTEVGSATTTLSVYFAEAGTGHIFTVNTETGAESRISNTTIPEASYASFSPSGLTVALRSQNDRRASTVTVGSLSEGSGALSVTELNKQIEDFSFINETELLYSLRTPAGLENRAFSTYNQTDTALFSVPFFEATVQYGTTSTSTHYVYPKPAYGLEGYLYSVRGGRLNREPIQGFGLTMLQIPGYIVYTKTTDLVANSYIYNQATATTTDAPVIVLPEKCTQGTNLTVLWCGHERGELPVEFPDGWYRGTNTFSDSIWEIDLENGSAISLVDTLFESGRAIDIIMMAIGHSQTALYFINKNDNTLWMYEL